MKQGVHLLSTSSGKVYPMLSDDIKVARRRKGYTQKQLAEATGLSIDSIKGFECGAAPGAESMARLHAALELPVRPDPGSSGELLFTVVLPGGLQLQVKGPRVR